jgi:hypothetical protein
MAVGGQSGAIAPPAGSYGGYKLSSIQTGNAFTIWEVGNSIAGVGSYGITIALMAAMQESKLVNLSGTTYGGGGSAGLFQQEAIGWGSYAQRTDPASASKSFFHALLNVSNWQQGSGDGSAVAPVAAGEVADKVQGPKIKGLYAQWYNTAITLMEALPAVTGSGPNVPDGTGITSGSATTSTQTSTTAAQAATAESDDGSQDLPIGAWPTSPPVSAAPREPMRADSEVDLITIQGARIKGDIRAAVVDATASLSTSEVSEITLIFHDPQLQLWNNGEFDNGLPVTYADQYMQIISREISAGDDGLPNITIVCRSAVVQALIARQGTLVMQGASASDFVMAECKAVGAPYVCELTPTAAQIQRDPILPATRYAGADTPSSWTTFNRLAQGLGFLCFETGGTIYFGKPSWLIKNSQNTAYVTYRTGHDDTDMTTVPGLTDSSDADDGPTLTFSVPYIRSTEFRPGVLCTITEGLQGFNDSPWMVSSVTISLASGSDTEVTLIRPLDPLILGVNVDYLGNSTNVGALAGDPNALNTKSHLDFAAIAQSKVMDGATFASGSAPLPTVANPTTFDSEGLVRWAAGRTGVVVPTGASNQYAAMVKAGTNCDLTKAKNTIGALGFHSRLPDGTPSEIVVISLGNGRTIESNATNNVCNGTWDGRPDPLQTAGLIPGMSYITGSSQEVKNQQQQNITALRGSASGTGAYSDSPNIPLYPQGVSHSFDEMLAFAESQHLSAHAGGYTPSGSWKGYCASFVAQAWGSEHGYPGLYAVQIWPLVPASQKVAAGQSGALQPPPGALLIWDMNDTAGHVTIYAGSGYSYGTDMNDSGQYDPGNIGYFDARSPMTSWGGHYVGWMQPDFDV